MYDKQTDDCLAFVAEYKLFFRECIFPLEVNTNEMFTLVWNSSVRDMDEDFPAVLQNVLA
jgi:hypothetical protein